jgi:hypothetical protein
MVGPMPGGRRRIDRIMDPAFIRGLDALPLTELRERRREAMQEEADLSYVRRMLQGRIEIIEQHVEADTEISDEDLVARLTQALVPNTTSPGGSSRHVLSEPQRLAERRRYVERLIADVGLSDPAALAPEEARQAVDRLREQERLVSSTRGELHAIIDELTGELGRRYRAGEAS